MFSWQIWDTNLTDNSKMMNSSSKVNDTYFWQLILFKFIPILELSVKFASQTCHENINKPLDGTYLADFGIDLGNSKITGDLDAFEGEFKVRPWLTSLFFYYWCSVLIRPALKQIDLLHCCLESFFFLLWVKIISSWLHVWKYHQHWSVVPKDCR